MFSQDSDYSEVVQSQDCSIAAHMIQEMALTDSRTGENTATKSPDIHIINNSEHYDVQTDSDTCCEHTNGSLHYGRTRKMLVGSSGKNKQSKIKKMSTAVKQVHFALPGQDPPLKSAVHAKHLNKISRVVVSQTDTQSTYFSDDTNLQATSSKQINLSHTRVYTKLTDGSSNQQGQMRCNTKSTSDLQQNEVQLNVHSKLDRQPNTPCTMPMNENTHEIPNSPNCASNLKKCTCDLPQQTGTKEKQATNSSGSSENMMINESSMEAPKVTCCFLLENPLQMRTTTGHNDQNGKQTESSRAIENPAEMTVSELNNKSGTEQSQNSCDSMIRNKVDSKITVMSRHNCQTVQNTSKSSVTSTNDKQMENSQSLSTLQDFMAESQFSDQFGLTQSMLTQPQEGSFFVFGIKKIWVHSTSEYVPNCELPEGFWMNKTTPFPNDLLKALEDF
jgi:hypothetical protein